jgi:putative transposase
MKYNPEIHHRRSIRLPGYDYGQAGLYFITICAWQRQCIFGAIEDGEMHLNPVGEIARDEWLKTAKMRPNIDIAEFVVMPNHVHGIIAIGDGMDVIGAVGVIGRGTMHRAPTDDTEKFGKPTSNMIPTIVNGETDVTDVDMGVVGANGGGAMHRTPTDNTEQFGEPISNRIPAIVNGDKDVTDTNGRGTMHRAPTIDTEKFGKPTSNTIPTIIRGYKAAVTTQVNILRQSPHCPVWQRNYYENVVRSEAEYLRIADYILNNPRQWQEDSLHHGK